MFLTALFFLVPVVREVVGTFAAFANVGRFLVAIGTAGEIAPEVYNVADDPDNLPLAIFSIILAPLAITDMAKMGKAANKMRAMSPDEIKGRARGSMMA